MSTIAYKTAIGMGSELLDGVHDNVIWFAKEINSLKFRPLFSELEVGKPGAPSTDKLSPPSTAI